MGKQTGGLASEQIATPQTVLRMAEKCQPGWTCRIRLRPVVRTQDTAHYILIDGDAESQCNLLGNARTAPTGIAPLHGHDGVDEFFVWPLRAGATPALGRKQPAVLS